MRRSVASGARKYSGAEWLQRAACSLDTSDRLERYKSVFSLMSQETSNRLLRRDVFQSDMNDVNQRLWTDLVQLMERTDELGGFQFLEIRASLPDELLMYADKMSMAHSLEVRVPFLDQEVVEFVERLDASMKVRHGRGKWIHRRVCERFLPREIMQRKKQGFAVNVVDDWLRQSVNSVMDDVLLDTQSKIFDYLDPEVVATLLKRHKGGHADNHKILFSLIALEYSLQNYSSWSAEVGTLCV
jgi:asparagine synthase (glutamine-hydrolysing)